MIEAHTLDSWTRVADRQTIGFRNATILGGFAAPLFLFLAGVSVPLAVTRAAGSVGWGSAVERVCKRGLEIFLLAFLFRFQAFVLSPGGPAIALFRVDILNVMGPAIAAAAVMMSVRTSAIGRAASYGIAATVLAMATPIVRASPLVDALPTWIQWYLRPAGEYTTFTLFPWAGFVLCGAAVGVLIGNVASSARVMTGVGACGAMLALIGLYTAAQPSIYAVSSFWTSSPTWFAIRAGIVMISLAALSAFDRAVVVARLRPLETLGRHSLFVYWIHVELVYGYASWIWKGRLPLWGTVLAYVTFCCLMYWVVKLKTQSAGLSRPRSASGTPEAAPA